MTDADIKKLAEAMGIDPMLFGPLWGNPIFDPRKDANHDYAVLEWYRARGGDKYGFCVHVDFSEKLQMHYQIGDYARAALKVLA